MRTKEEIHKDINEKFDKGTSYPDGRFRLSLNERLLLEIILDIRDLLQKENTIPHKGKID